LRGGSEFGSRLSKSFLLLTTGTEARLTHKLSTFRAKWAAQETVGLFLETEFSFTSLTLFGAISVWTLSIQKAICALPDRLTD
jgi:hypothetical protein